MNEKWLLLFALLFLVPALKATFRRPETPAENLPTVRRRLTTLWIVTAGTLAAHTILTYAWLDGWISLDGIGSKLDIVVLYGEFWVVVTALKVLEQRVMSACKKGGAGAHSPGPTRTATLLPRRTDSPITLLHWLLLQGTWAVLGCGAVLLSFAGEQSARRWLSVAACIAAGSLAILLTRLMVNRGLRAPEPLDPTGNPDLARDYRRHRERMARGRYWLGVTVVVMTGGMALGFASGRTETLVLVGPVMFVGFWSFHAYFERQVEERSRIRRKLDRLTRRYARHRQQV